jgi:uncharacterized protein
MSTIERSVLRRQIGIYLAVTYALVLALALAFPNIGLTPMLMMGAPTIAVAVAIAATVRRGERGAAWRGIGFGPASLRHFAAGLLLPVALVAASFGIAAAAGVVRFAGLAAIDPVQLALEAFAIGLLLALAEEIGWRGFLLPRLAELTRGSRAALLTGAGHAAFHLPALTLTSVYQGEGNRFIVVPMVMVTLTAAGVLYGWLRLASGSIWPVALAHSTFNAAFSHGALAVTATSPAIMAYVTTETGVVTMLLTAATAVWLIRYRFAEPAGTIPADQRR